jgi:hypothetical protein
VDVGVHALEIRQQVRERVTRTPSLFRLADADGQHRNRSAVRTLDGEGNRVAVLSRADHGDQREIVIRPWNRQQRLSTQRFVVDQRLVVARYEEAFGFVFEADGPVARQSKAFFD